MRTEGHTESRTLAHLCAVQNQRLIVFGALWLWLWDRLSLLQLPQVLRRVCVGAATLSVRCLTLIAEVLFAGGAEVGGIGTVVHFGAIIRTLHLKRCSRRFLRFVQAVNFFLQRCIGL